MVCSMTGYATIARELAQGTLTLELRSVNGRYLDVQFRMAEELRAVEPALRELVTGAVARGKVDCRINYAAAPLARGDVELGAEVLARLAQLSRAVRAAIPDAQPLRVSDVLHWPGVLGDEAAPPFPDVQLAQVSTGATFQFEDRGTPVVIGTGA